MTVEQAHITVTRGRRFDYGAVTAIDRLVTGSGERAGWLGEVFADGHCWVARKADTQDGEIVGFALLTPTFFRRWFIELLIVHPDHRRQGVGTALVRACEAECAAPQLFVSTNESNTPMQALLARLDYQPSGRVENLDEHDPELIYVKRLGQ
jgi:ribosomal protein S18 acetylase RimI-like enzyme